MPVIKILPHAEYCPTGKQIEAPTGTSICEALLDNHIEIEHACELSCACTMRSASTRASRSARAAMSASALAKPSFSMRAMSSSARP